MTDAQLEDMEALLITVEGDLYDTRRQLAEALELIGWLLGDDNEPDDEVAGALDRLDALAHLLR